MVRAHIPAAPVNLFRHVDAARLRRPTVVTVGNFDGVHRGHHEVLKQLSRAAIERGCVPTLVLFEPQPQELFRPGATARLTTFREKMTLLAREPVGQVVCLRFDAAFAALPATTFVERVLVRGLLTRHLVIGDDFRFGAGRMGDVGLLEREGRRFGFTVEAAQTFMLGDDRVSSTRVREHLARGELDAARDCLGRSYALTGRVVRGAQRGREIGTPTANLDVHDRVLPVRGVYAVRVTGIPGGPRPGVANAGTRPTVDGKRPSFEVHLLDFAGDLYGSRLTVELVSWLRDERRFESLDALKTQISEDITRAAAVLSEEPNHKALPT